MKLVKLGNETFQEIYEQHMRMDFPPEELKPFGRMADAMDAGQYAVYGAYEGEELMAYACFGYAREDAAYLLDYYAVVRGKRDIGTGSAVIALLRGELPFCRGLLVEYERVSSSANESERITRTRRQAFYRRNGFRDTDIDVNLFGVDFDICYLPIAADLGADDIYAELYGAYHTIMPEHICASHLRMRRKKEQVKE